MMPRSRSNSGSRQRRNPRQSSGPPHNDQDQVDRRRLQDISMKPNSEIQSRMRVRRETEEVKKQNTNEDFDKSFAVSLACSHCYIVRGHGRTGFQYRPEVAHQCEQTILMVARRTKQPLIWVKVRPRRQWKDSNPGRVFSGQFKLCEQYEAGTPCRLGEARCTFCHNEVEQKLWQMDKDNPNFDLNNLITVQRQEASGRVSQTRQNINGTNDQAASAASAAAASHHASASDIVCPFQIEEVCGSCWNLFTLQVKQKGNNCSTTGMNHKWDNHRAFLLRPENQLIRPFHSNRRSQCIQYESFGHCVHGDACRSIHGAGESKVYCWMAANNITSLDWVAAHFSQKPAVNAQKRTSGALTNAPEETSGASASTLAPRQGPTESWFCRVCNEDFVSRPAFDKHCGSARHDKNLLTDTDRPWHYRPPPLGADYPQLCSRLEEGTCKYGDVPDMYNQCRFAHNTLELEEWKERDVCWKYKKSVISDPNGVFSYIYGLQDEFEKVKLESDMMMQKIEGVHMDLSPEGTLYTADKHFNHTWTFTIQSQKELKKVCLFLNENRHHFHLATEKRTEVSHSDQVDDGRVFLIKAGKQNHYTVKVNFHAGLNGSFRQKVIFDFGTRPLLAVALDVEVGHEFVRDEILKLRTELPVERWTTKTHTVVPFSTLSTTDPSEDTLLCKYKPPDTSLFSQSSLRGGLSHNNYVYMMHRLVEMEELERTRVASRFNIVADIELTEMIPGKDIRAPIGHLFARVPLTEQQLNEDTDVGSLMLSGSVTAWVGMSQPEDTLSTPVVYEAEVVTDINFGFDGRGKDYFYMCLSKRCCSRLNLTSGSVYSLAVQLQIDRLPFCRMHYGLDQLPDTSVVFPDLRRYDKSSNLSSLTVKSSFLNTTQMEIVQYMTMTDRTYTPPLVVYGPFGSGKTETLAQATEVLIRTVPGSRILICALNDSAADLYIKKHFSKSEYLKTEEILRVYSPSRRKDTISDDMHPYCQKNVKGQFRLPDEEAINQHRIIVTSLTTSLMLTDQNMRGRFTHILLDEAGQCLECEAVLPLTLATSSTCVILAGDHRQLGPKSFSAKLPPTRLKLHISLLQRLYKYYVAHLNNPETLVKVLKVNYRSHPTIMSFLSKHFYDNAIECRSEWGLQCDFQPLVFYAKNGEENSDREGTSYYNMSEIEEVVKQIAHLYENWPGSWGDKSPTKIAVLTPYSQQVNKIRAALTDCKACFKDITVSKVSEVQGEEFHVVFISIVRTHQGIVNSNDEETLGFYSDFRLVNTAMTRARCQVSVVGDPSSLTCFGYCMPIWKSYLECCSKNGTLYQCALLLNTHGVNGELQDRPRGENLVYVMPEEVFNVADMEDDEILQQLKMKREPEANTAECNGYVENHAEGGYGEVHFISWRRESTDNQTSQLVHRRKKVKWKRVPIIFTTRGYNRVENDEFGSSDEDDDGRSKIYQEYDEAQLLTFLRDDPNTYKRCLINISGAQRRVAENLNSNDRIHNIHIPTRNKCNRAFDGDEVLVKVTSIDDPSVGCHQGEVVGILSKAMMVKLCVCRIDHLDPGIFIPLNKGFPLMNNLVRDHHPKGKIAIYRKRKWEGIQIKRYESLDFSNPSSKLFLVRLLKWGSRRLLPLGIAVDVIPAPTGIEDGEIVMKLEYNLHEDYHTDTVSEIEELYNGQFQLPDMDLQSRCNFADDLTFTIDPQGSEDLDDALSVRKTKNGWCIGIHIADVTYFVPQDSSIDKEAKKRCLTYYQPIGSPVAMLPPRLSEDLCSLKQGEERMALSVMLHVNDKDFKPLRPVEVSKCVIRSDYQLTYKEAQQIIDGQSMTNFPEDMVHKLMVLNQVAKKWRHERLRDSSYAIKPDEVICLDAHRLIEEMMIKANHEIAKILVHEMYNIVPLQVQHPPNEESLNEWCSRYYLSAKQSLTLETVVSSFTPPRSPMGVENSNSQADLHVISHQFLSCLKDALERNDDKALQNLVATSRLQPELAAAEFAYIDIQNKAEYKCSADIDAPAGHASLNLVPYLHFTSPIRRYIDIVVHRLVKAVIEKRSAPYNPADIQRICSQCNSASIKQRMYDKDKRSLKMNVMMKEQPLVLYPIVESVQADRIFLRFPTLREIPLSAGSLKYSVLDLQTLPIYDEGSQEVELCWEGQLYIYDKYCSGDTVQIADSRSIKITLDPYHFVTQVPAEKWQELLNSIKTHDSTGLREKANELLNSTKGEQPKVYKKDLHEDIKTLLRKPPVSARLVSGLRQGNLIPSLQRKVETLLESTNTQIPAYKWQELLNCIREHDFAGLRAKANELLESDMGKQLEVYNRDLYEDIKAVLKVPPARVQLVSILRQGRLIPNLQKEVDKLLESTKWVKKEVRTGDKFEESVKILLRVSPAQVHRVQLISSLQQRQLTPQIQLFTLAEDLDICIEHHQDPINCFATTPVLKTKTHYSDTSEYKNRWVPVLKVEAAYQAITNNDSFFLRGVNVEWKERNGVISGKLKFKKEFCDEYQVFGFGEERYLCVRYHGIAVAEKFLGSDTVKIAQTEDKVSFVVHCLKTKWKADEETDETTVEMVVHQWSMPFPDLKLLNKQKATIEATGEPLPMGRMLSALNALGKHEMAKAVALGHRPRELDPATVKKAKKKARSLEIPGYVAPNDVQWDAVMKSLSNSFSLIHGPPGTGKTVTGARIAINFAKVNRDDGQGRKVLYCGPSNKSVEVVIENLKKAGELQLVRVYSQDIVKLTYPIPTELKPPRHLKSSAARENLRQECCHPDIALHELIRIDSHCPRLASEIRQYDRKFKAEIERLMTDNIRWTKAEKKNWREEVERYRQVVKKASAQVLGKADIVLDTCVGSAAGTIKQSIGDMIYQVLIDEAGMCTEPEAMVPLTSCNARQVVLIGDHKQLEPIVQSKVGQLLGLKKSLFERYVKETDMLTIQYRMHEAIAKLPSDLFYDGRLVCGKPEQEQPSELRNMWPGGVSYPIAFVNIRGEEKAQVITTADGNEQSKYNPEEAEYTAKVVKALVTNRKIPHSNIQVLSQYRAQCKEIREQFQIGENKVESKVTTVTKSQGSEVDYIVLSTVCSLPSKKIETHQPKGWMQRHLGSIADPHQMNVALTRAKKGLIIIGNQELLSVSPLWKQLLEYYRGKKAVTEPGPFLQNIWKPQSSICTLT